MVRPKLEYASDVRDPHHVGDIEKLENIQQRAARWVMNDYSTYSSVTSMLNQLPWPSVQSPDNKHYTKYFTNRYHL